MACDLEGQHARRMAGEAVSVLTLQQKASMQTIKLSKLKPNPSNPRVLRDEKFIKLKNSIEAFPDMLQKRPIVAVTDKDGKYMVLGGNMRLKACADLGMKEVPVILADEWTEEQRREFIVKDNVGYGEWDWDALSNEWDAGDLDAWGLDVPKVPDFEHVPMDEQPRLDEKTPIECPKCGHEFTR